MNGTESAWDRQLTLWCDRYDGNESPETFATVAPCYPPSHCGNVLLTVRGGVLTYASGTSE